MLKVLVVGSGARENAIVWKLLQSPKVKEVLVAPGNAGTNLLARQIEVMAKDVNGVVSAALQEAVNLVIVGPEDPLSAGMIDALEAAGIPAFGPSREAARIESSKSFAKSLMFKYGIPCAKSATFSDLAEAEAYLNQQQAPIVIKADGLAAGKGVFVAATMEEAQKALHSILTDRTFGAAGNLALIEECLSGTEVSLLAFTDGKTVVPMVPACDYKRIYDNDQGPNTGGMGAYSPPGFFGPEMIEQVKTTILEPTVRAMAAEGRPYKGVLYAGLMVSADGPKVLEFNARFGDPETQVILPRLDTDLVDIAFAVINGTLDQLEVHWSDEACVGVVLASEGYPGDYVRGLPITGLDQLDDGVIAFHAGTRLAKRPPEPKGRSFLRGSRAERIDFDSLIGEVQTDGGRVLTLVAKGKTIAAARRKVYANVDKVQFRGVQYRTDIAAREVQHTEKEGDPDDDPSHQSGALDAHGDLPLVPPEAQAEAIQRHNRAVEMVEQRRIKEAQVELKRAVALNPNAAESLALLGTTYLMEANLATAAVQWEAVVRLSPRKAEPHHNLGSIYARQGRLSDAVLQFEACLTVDPQYVSAVLGLAAVWARKGDYQEAIQQFERALDLDPSNSEARLDLAAVLAAAGEKERARRELQSCLDINPGQALLEEARQLQKALAKKRWI